MLQQTPEAEIVERGDAADDDRMYCAACGVVVTRQRWAIAMAGRHDHVFVNPSGFAFEIGCFREAPGSFAIGPATSEATWFPSYAWQVAVCLGCDIQLGWRYAGGAMPAIFFGLIRRRIAAAPPARPLAPPA
ncbi:MAG: hypothetical protein JNK11_11660 [Alphaproteobacteria bacterium]|nr:hypothetical protein [Alphaproteobacteria bacterium]